MGAYKASREGSEANRLSTVAAMSRIWQKGFMYCKCTSFKYEYPRVLHDRMLQLPPSSPGILHLLRLLSFPTVLHRPHHAPHLHHFPLQLLETLHGERWSDQADKPGGETRWKGKARGGQAKEGE